MSTWQECLWAKAAPDEHGCWIWTGSFDKDGYAQLSAPVAVARQFGAHRNGRGHQWAYRATHGPIPAGMDVDHLCNVRACVNPDHLEAVTRAENNRRQAERLTQCKHGHERTAENVHVTADGRRICRPCRRAHEQRKAWRRRIKDATQAA